jgi:hypothetical protein
LAAKYMTKVTFSCYVCGHEDVFGINNSCEIIDNFPNNDDWREIRVTVVRRRNSRWCQGYPARLFICPKCAEKLGIIGLCPNKTFIAKITEQLPKLIAKVFDNQGSASKYDIPKKLTHYDAFE